MDELRRRFLPRFMEAGRERMARAREACATRLDLTAAELHALAGEAALLGLGEIDALAREAERAARGKCRDECAQALGRIESALDGLTLLRDVPTIRPQGG